MYIVPHKQLECPTRCEDAEFSWSSLHDVYDSDYPFLVWLLPKRYSCLFNPCLFNPCLTFDSLSVSFSFILLYPFLSFDFLFVFFLFLVWISTHVCLLNHFQYLQFLSVFFYPLLHVFISSESFKSLPIFFEYSSSVFSTVCNLNLVCLLNPCLTLLKFLDKTAHFLLLTFSSNDLYIRVLFVLIIWTHAFFWWSVGLQPTNWRIL